MSPSEQHVWINGRLEPAGKVRISPFDRGFNTGHGAFETLRAYGGRVFAATRHWQRLCRSCAVLGLPAPESALFSQSIAETLSANAIAEARVRFSISSGSVTTNTLEGGPTMTVVVAPAPIYPELEQVVTMAWPRNERSPMVSIKSLSYGENILALDMARSSGAGEALFVNTRAELCEGATSNVFLVLENETRLTTPALDSGCLPGVTRALVIELAHEAGLEIRQANVPAGALQNAREAFLTSSTREVQAISHIDGKPISVSPGPVSRHLAGLLKKMIAENSDP